MMEIEALREQTCSRSHHTYGTELDSLTLEPVLSDSLLPSLPQTTYFWRPLSSIHGPSQAPSLPPSPLPGSQGLPVSMAPTPFIHVLSLVWSRGWARLSGW